MIGQQKFWMRALLGVCVVATCGVGGAAFSAETERMYLSGKGTNDAVAWDFMCSAGQNANKWGKIQVPSNWELQGYGIYSYGRDRFPNGWPKVTGQYKRTFTPPTSWQGKKVYLVFEGVMTDTDVKLNGESVGEKHQGGYYRFKYDVTSKLKLGQENPIEVMVDDESADPTVNQAERRGDFWNYAGIFRPVYLEVVPQQSIDRVAIDAKADGSFAADVVTAGIAGGAPLSVEAQVMDLDGKPVGAAFSTDRAGPIVQVSSKIANPRLWNAEQPNLYQVEFRLKQGNNVVHSIRQKFGFRTIEARNEAEGSGVYVNGQRIMLKGACRHAFWPDSGRALSADISKADVLMMKEMNMNAVRCSHYPADEHFLETCDELGMYVLDELAGWHWKYSTPTGQRLVQEFVTHDVNHPSVVFWDNGNEGGWNTDLDDEFAKWDPQKRAVLHPGPTSRPSFFRGIDTKHYPNWADLNTILSGPNVYFPTEMLHGLYDGGAGASLEDYWNLMMKSPRSAGGFIWALVDEDVRRTDEGGKLDGRGNQAPDGIVGPYREREGSFYTVKEIWSPIVVSKTSDSLDNFSVENRYAFTDAKDCTFTWEWRKLKGPGDQGAGYSVVNSGKAMLEGGSLAPGKSGQLHLAISEDKRPAHDVVSLTAKDPTGRELWTWTFPTKGMTWDSAVNAPGSGDVKVTDAEGTVTLAGGANGVQINKKTGEALFTRNGKTLPIYNGPRLVEGTGTLSGVTQKKEGSDAIVTAAYTGDLKEVSYRMRSNGWVTIQYKYNLTGPHDFFGIGFDYAEDGVRGMRYLGNGPYRVWKNRERGGTLNVWEKHYNNTVTGYPESLKPGEKFDYPEFKGYYSDMRWVQLETGSDPITLVMDRPGMYMQVFTPQFPSIKDQGKTGVNFPSTGLAVLNGIPAVGSKFVPAQPTGPAAQQAVAQGDYQGSISIYIGALGR